MKQRNFALVIAVTLSLIGLFSQGIGQEIRRNKADGNYLFTITNEIASTPVKNQSRTGTCWSFSTVSFMEAELLRMGKGNFDLSEMFVVRNIYPEKAGLYVRMQGNARFSEGGTFHDVNNVFKKYGMVPESVYNGNMNEETGHNHGEMDRVLLSFLDGLIKVKGGALSDKWKSAFGGILDAYLGEVPESFEYEGKTYTPKTFAASLNLNPDDFVELSSFTHHPYYKKFTLEIPDNWDWNQVYNVPLDELISEMNHALGNGFSVAWDADVSEKYFSHGNGVAVVPEKNWYAMSSQERSQLFQEPGKEKTITPENRQIGFDNYTTTDDHLMHIVGTAQDQNKTPYYLVKNSWGTSNQCGGYVYVSEAYAREKTIHVMVHKDGLSKEMRKKLGL